MIESLFNCNRVLNMLNINAPCKTLTKFYKFFILFFLSTILIGCSSQKTIVNSLEEKDANEILVYLASKGIDSNKVPAPASEGAGGTKTILWNINVNQDQSIEAMGLLNQVGLPRRREQNLLGIFSSSSLVPSNLQEKVRYQAGLAAQIASTIRKIDGVLDSDVQISFPDEDPLNPNATKQKITASVYVKHNGILDDPNSHLNTRIKRLVAGSINGLDYDNVTVIGDRARYGESTIGSSSGLLGEVDKQYVHIWSLVIAKESLSRFQIIFFSFVIALLLLLLALSWLLWKCIPLVRSHGGIKSLFSFHPLSTDASPKSEELKSKEVKEDKDKNEPPPPQEKGIDET